MENFQLIGKLKRNRGIDHGLTREVINERMEEYLQRGGTIEIQEVQSEIAEKFDRRMVDSFLMNDL